MLSHTELNSVYFYGRGFIRGRTTKVRVPLSPPWILFFQLLFPRFMLFWKRKEKKARKTKQKTIWRSNKPYTIYTHKPFLKWLVTLRKSNKNILYWWGNPTKKFDFWVTSHFNGLTTKSTKSFFVVFFLQIGQTP